MSLEAPASGRNEAGGDENEDGERERYAAEIKARTEARLERTDFATLRRIFEEEQERSGVHKESKFCEKDKVIVWSEKGLRAYTAGAFTHGGAFYIGDQKVPKGYIFISPANLLELSDAGEKDLEGNVLHTLIHEETHASGNNGPSGEGHMMLGSALSFISGKPHAVNRSGFSKIEITGTTHKDFYVAFNEGITDTIAEEVYGEYAKRTGEKKAPYAQAYRTERLLVQLFTACIAESTGLPHEMVWKSIKQGYFSGIDLERTGLAQEFVNLFGEPVVQALRERPDNIEDKKETLLTMLNVIPHELSEESKERIRSAMTDLTKRLEIEKNSSGEGARDTSKDAETARVAGIEKYETELKALRDKLGL